MKRRENDFGSFSKQVPEKPVVEEQLKRFRSVGGDDHYHYYRPQNPPATMKTTGEQENNRNDSSLKNHQSRPLFTVLFIKCPLESCIEFALTLEEINRHLYKVHGIIAGNRCIATERCVRQQVHFRTRSLLQKHLKEEHADGSNYFQCYQCRPSNTIITFRRYNSLERHCHFNHDEGHFTCARCEEGQRRDPSTGCRLYAFSAKYCGLVVQHWKEVHRGRSAPLFSLSVIESGDKGDHGSGHCDHRQPAVKRRLKTEEALLIKERGEVIEK